MADKKTEDPLRRQCGFAVTDTLSFQIKLLEGIRETMPSADRQRAALVSASALAVVGIMLLVESGKDEHDIARIIVAARSLRGHAPVDSLDLLTSVCADPAGKS